MVCLNTRRGADVERDDKIAPHFAERDSACPSVGSLAAALSIVSSRAAAAAMLSGDDRLAIVPMVEVVNHRVTHSPGI